MAMQQPFRPFDPDRIPLAKQYRPWGQQVQAPYNKEYVRNIVHTQRNLQPLGMEFVPKDQLPPD